MIKSSKRIDEGNESTTNTDKHVSGTISCCDTDDNQLTTGENTQSKSQLQHRNPTIQIINYNNNNLIENKSNVNIENGASKAKTEEALTDDKQGEMNRLIRNVDIQIKLDGDEDF
jgi:hypothetical protein